MQIRQKISSNSMETKEKHSATTQEQKLRSHGPFTLNNQLEKYMGLFFKIGRLSLNLLSDQARNFPGLKPIRITTKFQIESQFLKFLMHVCKVDCSRICAGDHKVPVFHGYFHHLQGKSGCKKFCQNQINFTYWQHRSKQAMKVL